MRQRGIRAPNLQVTELSKVPFRFFAEVAQTVCAYEISKTRACLNRAQKSMTAEAGETLPMKF